MKLHLHYLFLQQVIFHLGLFQLCSIWIRAQSNQWVQSCQHPKKKWAYLRHKSLHKLIVLFSTQFHFIILPLSHIWDASILCLVENHFLIDFQIIRMNRFINWARMYQIRFIDVRKYLILSFHIKILCKQFLYELKST